MFSYSNMNVQTIALSQRTQFEPKGIEWMRFGECLSAFEPFTHCFISELETSKGDSSPIAPGITYLVLGGDGATH